MKTAFKDNDDNEKKKLVVRDFDTNIIPFPSVLLSRKQAADYLGVTVQTLAIWKTTGRYSLPVVKVGRLAKYKVSDLEEFIRLRTQAN